MYLSYSTRPDIAFAVGQLSRQNASPRVSHLKTAKRVIQYLKGIIHLGIVYKTGTNKESQSPYGLVSYANSNYADNPKNCKSVMGYYFFINGRVVSWYNKKQRTISTSTIKVEYIVLGYGTQKNVWIRQFLNELSLAKLIYTCIFHGDNEISIILTKNA